MKTILLTGYDQTFAWMGDKTTPSKAAYAAEVNIDFWCDKFQDNPGTHPSWNKLARVIELLKSGYEFVFWMDADMIVTNPNRPLYFEDCLTVSRDWGPTDNLHHHFSTGAFVAHRNALPIFEKAITKTYWQNITPWDQGAIHETVRRDQSMERLVALLPGRTLNAVPVQVQPHNNFNQWQEGDFIVHLTGTNADRAKALEHFLGGT